MNPAEIATWLPFLKRVFLFRDLAGKDLERFALRLKPLSLPRGAALFHQGDKGDSFYIITSGQVRLVSEHRGEKRVHAFLGPGEALGELALLTGERRSQTAVLESTSEFLVLSQKDFADMVAESPGILMQLSRTVASRLVQESRAREAAPGALQPQLVALMGILEPPDRALLAVSLAHALVEQTRRRVLLVDMLGEGGGLARALGLKALQVEEGMLGEGDLRDPALLSRLVQVHASGLGVLTLPPAVLSGRLFEAVYLIMNLLRHGNDFVLLALGGEFGPVEQSVLYEVDKWLLAGDKGQQAPFLSRASELRRASEPKNMVEIWLGEEPPSELRLAEDRPWVRVAWPTELGEAFRAGQSPFALMNKHAASLKGVERLARRLGRVRVGVAMGTGAALGYTLIGVLKRFEREGIAVDVIAGTSAGSVMGGLYALGLSAREIEHIARGVDKAWVYENLFWDLTLPRSGLFAGTTLLRFLRSYFGEKEFKDLEVPFACVATDIETGEEVVLREGQVAPAIRASCGIPLIFQPFHYQGRFLVDGGLVDPVPIQVASQMGADILISINLTMPAGKRRTALRRRRESLLDVGAAELDKLKSLALPTALKAPHFFQVFFQMIYTMEYEIAKSRSALAHVTIHPDLSGFSWTELHRATELIEAGESVAESFLPKIKALLPFFSDYCTVDIKKGRW